MFGGKVASIQRLQESARPRPWLRATAGAGQLLAAFRREILQGRRDVVIGDEPMQHVQSLAQLVAAHGSGCYRGPMILARRGTGPGANWPS